MLDLSGLKPSTVLSAMVAGLLKSKGDRLFEVDMGTYGKVKNNRCYGGVSALTLAEMFGGGRLASEIMLAYVNPGPSRSAYIHLSEILQSEISSGQDSLLTDKLKNFESAINYARVGGVWLLIEFLTGRKDESFDDRWELDSYDWELQLPIVKDTIVEMIAAGY